MSRAFAGLGRLLIAGFDRPTEQSVRIRCGYAAGWVSIAVLGALFAVRLGLGLASGAVSVVAAALNKSSGSGRSAGIFRGVAGLFAAGLGSGVRRKHGMIYCHGEERPRHPA